MKKIFQHLFAIITLATLFVACRNNDNDDTVVITVDNAAEYVAASLATATCGAIDNMNYVSDQIVGLIGCNESQSETRTVTETKSNGEVTVTYTIVEDYYKICSGVEVLRYKFSADQMLTSERLNTDHSISGAWYIEHVQPTSTELHYDGNYSRGGDWTYNLEDNHTDNVTASFIFSDVTAKKSDSVIFGGTSTFSLNGTSTIYDPFTFEGNILFQANNTCVATFSSGEQYEINLDTGGVTQI